MVNSDNGNAMNQGHAASPQQSIAVRRTNRMSELKLVDAVQFEENNENTNPSVPVVVKRDSKNRMGNAGQQRSTKKIALEHLTTLAHTCIVAFSLYIMYKSFSYLGLFTMHPLCYAIGWMFLMTEAVMLFSNDSIFSAHMDRAWRIRLHWILQTIGLVFTTIAFIVIIIHKENKSKSHFTTWHGLLGLISMILCYVTCANGTATLYCSELRAYISPRLNKIFHIGTGIATVFIGAITLVFSLYTNWFNFYTEKNPDIFFVCFVMVVCGLMWSIGRPGVNLCRMVRSS